MEKMVQSLKTRLIYVPLENIENRYSEMMNTVIETTAKNVFSESFVLYPKGLSCDMSKIDNGEFLDINKTSMFKARQLEMIASLFLEKQIKDGDCFLFADMFFPGIESLRYMAELQKIKIKIYGFNHAGRADSQDFVQGLGKWADHAEEVYHRVCDKIFVGSKYHLDKVKRYFGNVTDLSNHGIPWNPAYIADKLNGVSQTDKSPYCIWPHRVSSEKGIEEFRQIVMNHKIQFVVTSCGPEKKAGLELQDDFKNVRYYANLKKDEYYRLFQRATWYLSTAFQENFGYTLQEAIYLRCHVMVPNRACYAEMVPEKNRYKSSNDSKFKDFFSFTKSYIVDEEPYKTQIKDNTKKILEEILKG